MRIRDIEFAPVTIATEHRADGSMVLRSRARLRAYPSNLALSLDEWAERTPSRPFLAEREDGADWRVVSYAQAATAARAIARALTRRGLGPSRPVVVLSGNSLAHGLLMLGCFRAGVPIAPVSPAYSLMSRDCGKVRSIAALVEPGLVFVERPFGSAQGRPQAFERALHAIDDGSKTEVVSSLDDLVNDSGGGADPGPVRDPDAIAKILFTSGSTGEPKAVINTHRMLSANQEMIRQCWPFLEDMPPRLLDWLPWNHTFGGNHNFNIVLRNGGTMYIDGGRPTPALIEETVRNLREVSPNIYFNVPAGFAMLLAYLERDDELARCFLRDLRLIFYAGSSLPQDLWTRLARLAIRHLGAPVAMTSSWGTTETAPMATSAHFHLERAGVIGVPAPGVEIKLVPSGSKMEMRVRGDNVTPGYYKRPDLTRDAFDDEGFYVTGDAGALFDAAAPEKGLVFDGRTAENFKLQTGTWVHVGSLRVAVIEACSPALQDLVVCGHDRAEVGILAWPMAGATDVAESIRAGLTRHNAENAGASCRVTRALLLTEPPSIDANEITDKGYVNQRAVLERRAGEVERLFSDPPDREVIVIGN